MAVAMAVSTLMAIWIISLQESFFIVHTSFLCFSRCYQGSGVGRSASRDSRMFFTFLLMSKAR